MSKGKYSKKHSFSIRPIVLLLTVALLIGGTIGGTIAWLTATTQEVENTFTVGNIDITLTEDGATTAEGEDTAKQSFKMVPGNELAKNPLVTVEGGSEKCWLFVKVTESTNLGTYINYEVGTGNDDATTTDVVEGGWTQYTPSNPAAPANVKYYYRIVEANTANQVFGVIGYEVDSTFNSGKVFVNTTVTKELMDALEADDAVQPTLTFEAAAVQYANIGTGTDTEKVTAAFAELPAAFKPATSGN